MTVMTQSGLHEVMAFEIGDDVSDAVKRGELNFGDAFLLKSDLWVLEGECDGNLIVKTGGDLI